MNVYTVAFFGHRQLNRQLIVEHQLEELIRHLLSQYEYVNFLVGRNGEFDQTVSSTVRKLRQLIRNDNSALSLILPYLTEEYVKNRSSFENYYNEIEICYKASTAHFKKAISIRNQEMIDRADLVVVYVEHTSGGAYQALRYAQKHKKPIINLAEQ